MADFRMQDGRPGQPSSSEQENGGLKETATRAGEYVADRAKAASAETSRLAGEAAATAREYPVTTVAVAAGLAFAVGALWMMRTSRRQSELDALLGRLSDLSSRGSNLWSRGWR